MGDRIGVVWEGEFFVPHSFARVNEEIALHLNQDRISLSLLPKSGKPKSLKNVDARLKPIVPFLNRRLPKVDFHVRFTWPPNWEKPRQGELIVIQPWEYGSIPIAWLKAMEDVREIWATSNFVRDSYVWSGVPENRVCVIPHGIDPQIFRPDGPKLEFKTEKSFRFLFVGGLIHRKGYDVLINAYMQEFRPDEDVCLVLRDVFYQSVDRRRVQAIADRQDVPKIVFLDDPLSPSEIPELYRACQAYVQPYRGEGFCLPVLEAMACGLPTITTGFGATLDFCHAANSYLIPSALYLEQKKLSNTWEILQTDDGLSTLDHRFWAEPDLSALRKILRNIFENYEEARHVGLLAAQEIISEWTWERPARMIEERLFALKAAPGEKLVVQRKVPTKSLVEKYNLHPPDLTKLSEGKPSWKAQQAHQAIRKSPGDAESMFRELAKIPGWKGEALYGLALLAQERHEDETARAFLQEALKASPFHTLAQQKLASFVQI